MIPRPLGRSPLAVPPLCLGGNVFGWTADAARSFELLDTFVEAGLNLIDTADAYSRWVPGHVGGESETLIGQWLAARGPAMRPPATARPISTSPQSPRSMLSRATPSASGCRRPAT